MLWVFGDKKDEAELTDRGLQRRRQTFLPDEGLHTHRDNIPAISPLSHTPASTSFPLLGVGQADPLLRHGADVVVGVEVGLFNFASVYHVNDIVDGDAAGKSRGKADEEDGGWGWGGEHFKGGLSKKKIIADTRKEKSKTFSIYILYLVERCVPAS